MLPELFRELERVTAALDAAGACTMDQLADVLAERERLVAQLASVAASLDEHGIGVVTRAQASGRRLRQRLLVERASRRDEMGRLYQSGCLLRALSADREAGRIDCQG
jgi:ParB-like chromosome segregation protein Spo0J